MNEMYLNNKRRIINTGLEGVFSSQLYIGSYSCQGLDIVECSDGKAVVLLQRGSGSRYVYLQTMTYPTEGTAGTVMNSAQTVIGATHYKPVACRLADDIIAVAFWQSGGNMKVRIVDVSSGIVVKSTLDVGFAFNMTGGGEMMKIDDFTFCMFEQAGSDTRLFTFTCASDFSSITLQNHSQLGDSNNTGTQIEYLGEDASFYYVLVGSRDFFKTVKIDKISFAYTVLSTHAPTGSIKSQFMASLVSGNRFLSHSRDGSGYGFRLIDTGSLGDNITTVDFEGSAGGTVSPDSFFSSACYDISRISETEDIFAFYAIEADRSLYRGIIKVEGNNIIPLSYGLWITSGVYGAHVRTLKIPKNRIILGYSSSTTAAHIRIQTFK